MTLRLAPLHCLFAAKADGIDLRRPPDDLVVWDNRSVIHRGRRYDYTQRRELRRVSTEDRGLQSGP